MASDRPPVEPLLLSAADAAAALGIGERLFADLNRRGAVPAPIKLGRRRLWSLATLREWADQGCPPRHRFKPPQERDANA